MKLSVKGQRGEALSKAIAALDEGGFEPKLRPLYGMSPGQGVIISIRTKEGEIKNDKEDKVG